MSAELRCQVDPVAVEGLDRLVRQEKSFMRGVRMCAKSPEHWKALLNDLREAVENISRPGIQAKSPVFPPVSETASAKGRAS
jgi:hypothetical protein